MFYKNFCGFYDRSLNHMSVRFQGVMRNISSILKEVYATDVVALAPEGGGRDHCRSTGYGLGPACGNLLWDDIAQPLYQGG